MLLHNTKIKEIMTSSIKTVGPMDLMMLVSDIFENNQFHHIPVVEEDGRLAGMISMYDYNMMLTTMSIFKTDWAALDNQRFKESLLVKEVMTKKVAKLRPEDTLQKAASIFRENLFHAIPIVDEADVVVGILTTYDMLNYAFDERKIVSA